MRSPTYLELVRFESMLCGLGVERAKRCLLVPAKAYIDDAGVKNTDEIFVFAGFVDTAENWLHFDEDWRSCLRETPSIDYFKMDEATDLYGQFTNWKCAARDAKLLALFDVIRRHGKRSNVCRAMYFTTPFAVFHRKMTDDLPVRMKRYSAAYLFGAILLTNAIVAEVKYRGTSDHVETVFDKHEIFGKRLQELYPLLCDFAERVYGERYPPSPLFRDDKDYTPLQLADILAWSLRRMWNGCDNEFQWILDELPSIIPISEYSLRLCERNIEILMAPERVPLPLSLDEESVREWGKKTGIDVDGLLISREWREHNESAE